MRDARDRQNEREGSREGWIQLLTDSAFSESAGVASTVRVERPPFHCGEPLSTGDQRAMPMHAST